MSKILEKFGNVTVVLGSQWGDEGKGKLIDILAPEYDIIARATGGANAGHTVYWNDGGETKKLVFHLIPSGMIHGDKICVVGNGVVLHIATMLEEIEALKAQGVDVTGRLILSDRAHIVFDYHKQIDALQEEMKGKAKVGTTLRGIGPAYADKISRIGIRLGELRDFEKFSNHFRQNVEFLKKMYAIDIDVDSELKKYREYAAIITPMLRDTAHYLASEAASGRTILIEGANATHLDIDHGTYPFVTSSNATIGGIITGLGISPFMLKSAIGIVKAYTTRVGAGVFPTELNDELGEAIRTKGGEFGSTTGRPRRCGWFDAMIVRRSVEINGLTSINLTKVDVLTGLKKLKLAVGYRVNGVELESVPADLATVENLEVLYEEMNGWDEDLSDIREFKNLPENCKKYILRIEALIGCSIDFIGVGQRRDQILTKDA
ncbi:MAG: adenylosuccinate synthase [Patescibacteria group bacterium]